MENYEKVEKLRERANVTYEEAKEALEQNCWDILDAMIYLEKNGRTSRPEQASYSTQGQKKREDTEEDFGPESSHDFSDTMKRFGRWCVKMIKKGCSNYFCVEKGGKEIFTVPILVLILATLAAFWLVLILLVVGLFFDVHYRFHGRDIKSDKINRAMDNASETANQIKKEFRNTDNP